MPNKSKKQSGQKPDWDKIAEETRQRCNRLTKRQREHYVDLAFRIIYGSNAKTPTRSH